jgi:hypothetical protein
MRLKRRENAPLESVSVKGNSALQHKDNKTDNHNKKI